jgi:hypothetical protein
MVKLDEIIEGIMWVIVGIFLAFALSIGGCSNPSVVSHEARVAGLNVVDLSGDHVTIAEAAEVVAAVAVAFDKAGLLTQTQVWGSLGSAPVNVYLPPGEDFTCPHTISGSDMGVCLGAYYPGGTAIFATKIPGQHLGCGSLPHELAHLLSFRYFGNPDGKHERKKVIWQTAGILDNIKIALECTPVELFDLRTWR